MALAVVAPLTRDRAAGKKLAAWAESHGARVSSKVAFLSPPCPSNGPDAGDRSCTADMCIEEGELLVEVPRSIVFETPVAPMRPVGVPSDLLEALGRVAESEDPHGITVALLVHHERMRGAASDFATYLDCLPMSFPTMPLCDDVPPWTPLLSEPGANSSGSHCRPNAEEAFLYHGTAVERLAFAGIGLAGPEGAAKMASIIEEIDPDGLWWHRLQRGSDGTLRWAAAAVQSRAHSSKRGGTVLVPLADAFNHSPTRANVELCEGPTTFQVRAKCAVQAGQELLLKYGEFSNAELLFNGGFVCSGNPYECVLVTRAELMEVARRHRKVMVCDALDENTSEEDESTARFDSLSKGLPPPILTADMPLLGRAVPPKVVNFIAGFLVSNKEFAAGIHESWSDPRSEKAMELRKAILVVVLELLETVLAPRYRELESEKEDGQLVTKGSSTAASPMLSSVHSWQRRMNILEVRSGERAVIDRLASAVRARIPQPVAQQPEPMMAKKRARTDDGSVLESDSR